jgi:NADH-quinone oxidoreductase subunit J
LLVELMSYVLVILTIIAAIFAARVKNLTRGIIAFAAMNILVAVMFYVLGAPYVAVFQLLVYAGAVTVLFLAALHTMRRG